MQKFSLIDNMCCSYVSGNDLDVGLMNEAHWMTRKTLLSSWNSMGSTPKYDPFGLGAIGWTHHLEFCNVDFFIGNVGCFNVGQHVTVVPVNSKRFSCASNWLAPKNWWVKYDEILSFLLHFSTRFCLNSRPSCEAITEQNPPHLWARVHVLSWVPSQKGHRHAGDPLLGLVRWST